MENEFENEQPDEKDHSVRSKITGLGQKIIGEIEELAGVVNADPLAQAEPVLQATPAISRAITKACRLMPGKAMQVVVGKRGEDAPMMTASEAPASSSDSSLSRSVDMRA